MKVRDVTAFIPARGGSKGLPGKNSRLLNGHPLIAYAINAAKRARTVGGDIIVSTDDELIAEHAVSYGAKVVERPPALSGDDVTSETVLEDWLQNIDAIERPEVVAFLQCTAPLMLGRDIDHCVSVVAAGYTSCCSVAPFHGVIWSPDDMPHGMRAPRQYGPVKWIEAGSVYAFNAFSFLSMDQPSRFCTNGAVRGIPASRCFEIDTLQDLKICEYLLQNRGLCEDMEVEDGLF